MVVPEGTTGTKGNQLFNHYYISGYRKIAEIGHENEKAIFSPWGVVSTRGYQGRLYGIQAVLAGLGAHGAYPTGGI